MSSKSSSAGKRTFTIEGSDLEFSGGKYRITEKGTPSGAAKKAAKSLFRMVENKDSKPEWKKYEKYAAHSTIKFLLRETTQGSAKKTKYYEAKVQHIKKADQKAVVINGVEIIHTKKIVVKSCADGIRSVGATVKSA
jgi:hypothetical protein